MSNGQELGRSLGRLADTLSKRKKKAQTLRLRSNLNERLYELREQHDVNTKEYRDAARKLVNDSIAETIAENDWFHRRKFRLHYEEIRVAYLAAIDKEHYEEKEEVATRTFAGLLAKEGRETAQTFVNDVQEASKRIEAGEDWADVIEDLSQQSIIAGTDNPGMMLALVNSVADGKALKDYSTDQEKIKAARGMIAQEVLRARTPEEGQSRVSGFMTDLRESLLNPSLSEDDLGNLQHDGLEFVREIHEQNSPLMADALGNFRQSGNVEELLQDVQEIEMQIQASQHGGDPSAKQHLINQRLEQGSQFRNSAARLATSVGIDNMLREYEEKIKEVSQRLAGDRPEEYIDEADKILADLSRELKDSLPKNLPAEAVQAILKVESDKKSEIREVAHQRMLTDRDQKLTLFLNGLESKVLTGKVSYEEAEDRFNRMLDNFSDFGPVAQEALRQSLMPKIQQADYKRASEQYALDPYNNAYGNTGGPVDGVMPVLAGMPGPTKALVIATQTNSDNFYGLSDERMQEIGEILYPGVPNWDEFRENLDRAAWFNLKEVYKDKTGRPIDHDLSSGSADRLGKIYDVLEGEFPQLTGDGKREAFVDMALSAQGNRAPYREGLGRDLLESSWMDQIDAQSRVKAAQNWQGQEVYLKNQKAKVIANYQADIAQGATYTVEELVKNPVLNRKDIQDLMIFQQEKVTLQDSIKIVAELLSSNDVTTINMQDNRIEAGFHGLYKQHAGNTLLYDMNLDFIPEFVNMVGKARQFPEGSKAQLEHMMRGGAGGEQGDRQMVYALEVLSNLPLGNLEEVSAEIKGQVELYKYVGKGTNEAAFLLKQFQMARTEEGKKEYEKNKKELDEFISGDPDFLDVAEVTEYILDENLGFFESWGRDAPRDTMGLVPKHALREMAFLTRLYRPYSETPEHAKERAVGTIAARFGETRFGGVGGEGHVMMNPPEKVFAALASPNVMQNRVEKAVGDWLGTRELTLDDYGFAGYKIEETLESRRTGRYKLIAIPMLPDGSYGQGDPVVDHFGLQVEISVLPPK